jgi:hypothetical protein
MIESGEDEGGGEGRGGRSSLSGELGDTTHREVTFDIRRLDLLLK